MRKPFIKLTAACVLTAIALYSGGLQQQAAATTEAGSPSTDYQSVEEQARHFVDELSGQPHFERWKNATLQVSPIGPGTHSWLVLVKQNRETVGYLVINAVETGGYQLGEYGTGSHPFFDQHTLSTAIKRLELMQPSNGVESLYVHPLLAAWKINDEDQENYADAASGELLPVRDKDWQIASSMKLIVNEKKQAPSSAKLLKSVSLVSIDPFGKLPWLTKTPMPLSTKSYWGLFNTLNNKEQLRYTAELFEGQMLYVWSVVGYSKWDSGHLYVALETDDAGTSRRYVPLLLLLELGRFYR